MIIPVKYLNLYRNVRGRYDLLCYLYKWDSDYKRDLLVTVITFVSLGYAALTLNSPYDFIALALDAGIIAVQLGGEMSIMPYDYRPSHGGVRYTVQFSRHVDHDEESFEMADILPARREEVIGFRNPIWGLGLCSETPHVSNKLDDILMLRPDLPFAEDASERNYIRSRHQLRYLTVKVADKIEHTTNGVKLDFCDLADVLAGEDPVEVRKSYYFDGLLTSEAFRSRIFRNNIKGEREVYTDMTTYFPVRREEINGQTRLRFRPHFTKEVSGQIGITTLLVTENRRVAMLFQGKNKVIGAGAVCLGGSGSMNYDDIKGVDRNDLRKALVYALAREMFEETGMGAYFDEIKKNTRLTGFFRWVDRCGKPEFVGVTRAGGVPFSKMMAIDGDEVVGYEEIPVTLNSMKDFHKAMDHIHENRINVALSSLMSLHRMTVIADYDEPGATMDQKKIFKEMSEFLFGS